MLCVRTAPAGNYRFLCRVFRRCKRRSSFLCCLRGDRFRLLLAVYLLRIPVRKQIAQRCFVHLCIQRVLSCAECSLLRCFRVCFRALLRLALHLLCDLLRFRSNAIGCIIHAAQCTGSHTAQRSTRGEVLRRAHRIDKRIIVSCGENLFISIDRCPL